MAQVELSELAAQKICALMDNDYIQSIKADIADALSDIIDDCDERGADLPMNILVMLKDYDYLLTALSTCNATNTVHE